MPVNSSIRIFPNPAKENVHIKLQNISVPPSAVRLYSLTGAQCFEQTFSSSDVPETITIALNKFNLKPGCYILKMDFGTDYAYESLLLIDK